MMSGDWARGLYVRCPWWVKRLSAPLIATLPLRLRLGPTYWRQRQAIIASQGNATFVAQYRRLRLSRIVDACVKGSPYYRAAFKSALGGIPDPEDFDLADLNRLPVLTKDDMRRDAERLLTVPRSWVDLVSTGGSSGNPVEFFLDKDRSPTEWAFVNHIWSSAGYEAGDRRAVLRSVYIRGVDEKPWKFDPALNELSLSPFHLGPEAIDIYLGLLAKFRVKFIHGYPSAISIVASHAEATQWQPPSSLRGVLPISEALFPHQRNLFKRAFGNVKIMPFYGLSEKVAIAGEVAGQPGVYEFEPLYGVTELVDDDGVKLVEPGQSGRIVSTGLMFRAMPLLRYETGDRGVLVSPAAPENAYRLRVRDIRARWSQEFLVARSGALIPATAMTGHSRAHISVLIFQFYQDTVGEVAVKVVPAEGCCEEDVEPFVHEMQQKVGESLKLHLLLTDGIKMTVRGKRPLVDQRLSLERRSASKQGSG
jgi:phenylacetate-CoA ligase